MYSLKTRVCSSNSMKHPLSLPQGRGCFMEFDEHTLVFKEYIQLFWPCYFFGASTLWILSHDIYSRCITSKVPLFRVQSRVLLGSRSMWKNRQSSSYDETVFWWELLVFRVFPPDEYISMSRHAERSHMYDVMLQMSFDSVE